MYCRTRERDAGKHNCTFVLFKLSDPHTWPYFACPSSPAAVAGCRGRWTARGHPCRWPAARAMQASPEGRAAWAAPLPIGCRSATGGARKEDRSIESAQTAASSAGGRGDACYWRILALAESSNPRKADWSREHWSGCGRGTGRGLETAVPPGIRGGGSDSCSDPWETARDRKRKGPGWGSRNQDRIPLLKDNRSVTR